ncbi:MAG TPA: polyketide synthase, partial [Fibrobacteria bacterium]|nr:polyketide synthase [Fibrobacteria bacterium]
MIFQSTPLKGNGNPPASVELGDLGNGVFSLQVAAPDGRNALTRDLLGQILEALEAARGHAAAKVLILRGTRAAFLAGGRDACDRAAERKFFRALAEFPYPIIASLQGDACGAGFLAASLCDFLIVNQSGTYAFTDAETGLFPSAAEDNLFRLRFGEARGADFLYGGPCTGRQLQDKGWSCPCRPDGEVDAHALELARSLARKSHEALRLLKQHLARPFVELAGTLGPVEMARESDEPPRGSDESPGEDFAPPDSLLEWETAGDSTLIVRLRRAPEACDWPKLVEGFGDMLARVKASRRFKAVVVASGYAGFLPDPDGGLARRMGEEMLRHISGSAVPVIAALEQGARGLAWFVAQCCDACVYHRQGKFSVGGMLADPELVRRAAALFAFRCGAYAGKEILLSARTFLGHELEQRGLAAADKEQVLALALRRAEAWSRWPLAALGAWKADGARSLRQRMDRQPQWNEGPEAGDSPEAGLKAPAQGSVAIPLDTPVVSAMLHPKGIVLVRMEDRQAKNMFSEALMDGLQEVFARVGALPACKAVILTGYDRYFASGGTKETLLAIQEGRARFTDNKTFQIAMDCPVPVVAALQGHGIGAGWGLGMFADFALHAGDSKFMSPYMNYGFTPGAGATFIFPERAGHDLARETLLTGREYAGAELKARGFPLPVVTKGNVLAAAFELARHLAGQPRRRQMALKRQFNQPLRMPLEEAYARELDMHGKTFVGKAETLDQIHGNFVTEIHPASASAAAGTIAVDVETVAAAAESVAIAPVAIVAADAAIAIVPPSANPVDVPADLPANLKAMLATELQLREDEIDDHTQFVDLGLDSITGVTWIRKINERLGTSIEATKIYSYPTLAKLAGYIREEAVKPGASAPAARVPVEAAPPPEARRPSPAHPVSAPSPSIPLDVPAPAGGGRLTSWRNRPAARIAPAPEAPQPAGYRPQPIAVIGMAGRFPQAGNLEEFWANIAAGRNCITPVPRQRWDAEAYYSPEGPAAGKTNCKWMGSLEEYDRFDPLFFNISPTEAESMDPQQRL